jgi:hypothetical protein
LRLQSGRYALERLLVTDWQFDTQTVPGSCTIHFSAPQDGSEPGADARSIQGGVGREQLPAS